MAADTEQSTGADSEKQMRRGPTWLVMAFAILALAGVVGVIVYGYLDRPGWIGVSGEKFWDYLDLLIVPAALAIGVYLLNRAQSDREREAEKVQQQREREAQAAQRERELEVENQRAQDGALQAYLEQMSKLMIEHGLWSQSMADNAGDTPEGEGQALVRDARAFIQRNKRSSAPRA